MEVINEGLLSIENNKLVKLIDLISKCTAVPENDSFSLM